MSTIGATFKTLADLGKEMNPDMASVATVVELLSQQNGMLDDIPWMEGNLPTGNRTVQRTTLPTVYFRRANQGVAVSKGTVAQIDDAAARIEGWSEVDEMILDLSPNPAMTRANEDTAFIQAMNQQLGETLISGNAALNPEQFTGFATRYATGVTGTPYLDSMINGGGSGSDNMSIYLVGWGPNTVSGLYPRNMPGGLMTKDHGPRVKEDTGNLRQVVYATQFVWNCGLMVKDWRYVIRICNIDHSALVASSGNANLVNLMIQALERLPEGEYSANYRPVFYVPRAVRTMLRIQINDKANNNLTTESISGRKVLAFDGVPVRVNDRLTKSEAAISFV